MSVEDTNAAGATSPDVAPLLARATAADRRAEARLATAIDDFFLAEHDRLDDRTRAAIAALVADDIAAIQHDLSGHAALPAVPSVLSRLIDSGLLRDAALMTDLLGRARLALLGEALAANRAPDAAPALLVRLTGCGDRIIEAAAGDYLLAESRRRIDLSADLYRRMTWWVAAALSEASVGVTAIERKLADAARRLFSGYDADGRLEAVAMRLAAAIHARPDELGALLIDALAEGRAAAFVAILAHAHAIAFADARDLVLDPDGDRLWLLLRAHGLPRDTIARIGLALADADHRRDIEAFADRLDTIAAVEPRAARDTLAPLALDRDFRAALHALARTASA